MPTPLILTLPLCTLVLIATTGARAQVAPNSEPFSSIEAPVASPPPPSSAQPAHFAFGGYVEAYYQWNFNTPSNRITNARGYDNRHNSFTLPNAALDAQWDYERAFGRVTFQIGHAPSTYYLSEPASPGSGSVDTSGAELWKYLQQAYVGYRFDIGRGLTVSAGLFLSPIGAESMAVHDNWNWSRSDLFFALPAYHTGVQVSYPLSDAWTVTLAGYNGWSSVVDNNAEKSISAQLSYQRADVRVSVRYFGGAERPSDAPEGRGWRHLVDAQVTWNVTPTLSLLAYADGGLEPTKFGVSYWAAGAGYARLRLVEGLFIAARGDVFYEHVASSDAASASPIFWLVPWVSSGTATVDYRPNEQVSFRLEYRHDHAGGDQYFGGDVLVDPSTGQFILNRVSQDTLTAGATTWF